MTQTLPNDQSLWRHSGWTVRATAGCWSTGIRGWPTSRAAILLWYCRSAATSYSKASYTAGWLPYSTDGRYTADDIVEKVAREITPAEVYYGLGILEKKSYITEADSTIPPDRAAFWHVLGLEPHLAERRMNETTVSVTKFGTVPIRPFAYSLAALKEEWTKNSGEETAAPSLQGSSEQRMITDVRPSPRVQEHHTDSPLV